MGGCVFLGEWIYGFQQVSGNGGLLLGVIRAVYSVTPTFDDVIDAPNDIPANHLWITGKVCDLACLGEAFPVRRVAVLVCHVSSMRRWRWSWAGVRWCCSVSRHVFVIRKTWRGKWSFANDAEGGRQLWAERRTRGEWVGQLVFRAFPDEPDHGGVAGAIQRATGAPFVALAIGAIL